MTISCPIASVSGVSPAPVTRPIDQIPFSCGCTATTRLDSNWLLAFAEHKIGDLLHRRINRADQRDLHRQRLASLPERPPDQVTDEQADEIDQHDRQHHADELSQYG